MWPLAIFRAGQIAVDERMMSEALNDRTDLRFFIGTPRVYVMSIENLSSQAGDVAFSIDLLQDDVHAVARSSAVTPREIAVRRVWQGVFQSAFENTLVEAPELLLGGSADRLRSTSAASQGEIVVVTSPKDPRLPTDAPIELLRHLSGGHRAVLPRAIPESGATTWWDIAPDGTTRSIYAPTMGYAKIVRNVNQSVRRTYLYPGRTSVDARPAGRVWSTGYNPGTTGPGVYDFDTEADKIFKDIEKKGGGGKAKQRITRGRNLPKVTATRTKGGHTEYSLVQATSISATLHSVAFFGLVLFTSTAVVLAIIYVMCGIIDAAHGRS